MAEVKLMPQQEKICTGSGTSSYTNAYKQVYKTIKTKPAFGIIPGGGYFL